MDIKTRFEQKFRVTPGCWVWTAYKNSDGYGQFRIGKSMEKAHRVSFSIYREHVDKGMEVLHSCDNPACVNPDHLSIGTHLLNMRDMVAKGRQATLKGNKNGRAKLTESEVIDIRDDSRSQRKIAKIYEISQAHVHRIKSLKLWSHIE